MTTHAMRPSPTDLFSEPLAPEDAPQAPASVRALKVSPQQPGQKLTPAQQRFNKLLTRIQNLTLQLQALDALMQKHHAPHVQAVSALHQQMDALQKTLVLQLHQHLRTLQLTKGQRRDLTQTVESLLLETEHLQDPELLALFNQYFSQEEQAAWAEDEAESVEHLRELARKKLSQEDLQDLPDDPDALLELLMRKMDSDRQAQASEAAQRKTRRPSPRQQQAEQEQLDAKATLRSLFRQLASALHPDRALDAAERERKTALMSQVNAAYERQDLAALLQLQLQTTALDTQAIARMADEKLNTMSTLLKQQVATLEVELQHSARRASMALNIPLHAKTSEAAVVRQLHDQRSELQDSVDAMQQDVDRVRDPAELKAWIKAQRQMAKQQASLDDWMSSSF